MAKVISPVTDRILEELKKGGTPYEHGSGEGLGATMKVSGSNVTSTLGYRQLPSPKFLKKLFEAFPEMDADYVVHGTMKDKPSHVTVKVNSSNPLQSIVDKALPKGSEGEYTLPNGRIATWREEKGGRVWCIDGNTAHDTRTAKPSELCSIIHFEAVLVNLDKERAQMLVGLENHVTKNCVPTA